MGKDKKWEDMGECVGVVRSHKFYESPVSSIVSEIFVTSVMFTIQNESITGLKIRIRAVKEHSVLGPQERIS